MRTQIDGDETRTPPRLRGGASPERREALGHGVEALAVEAVAVDHRSAVHVSHVGRACFLLIKAELDLSIGCTAERQMNRLSTSELAVTVRNAIHLSSGSLNALGFGFPGCGSGVTDPAKNTQRAELPRTAEAQRGDMPELAVDASRSGT